MSELTKERYLKMRLEGAGRTAIMKKYFGGQPPKFYKQLEAWGIKEADAEERELDLLAAEWKQTVKDTQATKKPQAAEEPKPDVPDPRDEEIARLRAELERIKANNVEAVRLSGAAAEKMQAEIDRLKSDEKTLSRLLTDTENKLEEVIKERDALLQTIEKAVDTQHDTVNHPPHYNAGKIECIDAIESATVGLMGIEAVCVGNVIKYTWRYSRKAGTEDLKKAAWYLEKLISIIEVHRNNEQNQEATSEPRTT